MPLASNTRKRNAGLAAEPLQGKSSAISATRTSAAAGKRSVVKKTAAAKRRLFPQKKCFTFSKIEKLERTLDTDVAALLAKAKSGRMPRVLNRCWLRW